MAKIWFVTEEPETIGDLAYELPAALVIESLGILPNDRLEVQPSVVQAGPSLANQRRLVLFELEIGDNATGRWTTGFYRVDLNPDEVIDIFGPPEAR